MRRKFRTSEIILIAGFSFILVFMLVHDWIPLGPLNDVKAVSESRSAGELIVVTLIGAVQIAVLLGLALWFAGKTYPFWAKLWLIVHPSFIFAGALLDWWIPYFFGYGAEERAERYTEMFGNTHAFLPVMNGIVPNTMHVMFHSTLLLCIVTAICMSVRRAPARRQTGIAMES